MERNLKLEIKNVAFLLIPLIMCTCFGQKSNCNMLTMKKKSEAIARNEIQEENVILNIANEIVKTK